MNIGIIVTTHCVEPYLTDKLNLTEKLCKSISCLGYPVCLASHTPIPTSTQEYCHGAIYDKDNDFHIDGKPEKRRTHGVAELKSVHNAVNFLREKYNITHFLKLTYDIDSNTDIQTIINKASNICEHQYEMVSCQWNTLEPSISTMCYFSSVSFFDRVFDFNNPEEYVNLFEVSIHKKISKLGLLDKVHKEESYKSFLGCEVIHHIHLAGMKMAQT